MLSFLAIFAHDYSRANQNDLEKPKRPAKTNSLAALINFLS
jgi:hypothetical protein